MRIRTFIPPARARQFETEPDRNVVFREDRNTTYEGLVRNAGDSIRILTPGKPGIRTFSGGKLHNLDDPGTMTGTSVTMPLNRVTDDRFAVDDPDRRQAEGSVKDVYMSESAKASANQTDSYPAKFAADKNIAQEKPSAATTADTVLDLINKCVTKLYENDVPLDTEPVLTAAPTFIEILRKAYEKLDTDNSGMLKNGRAGRYHSVIIKMSNNVHKDDTCESIMLRTKRSLAFVSQVTHSEACRPEKTFGDAVKGFVVCGGRYVRPKETITPAVKDK